MSRVPWFPPLSGDNPFETSLTPPRLRLLGLSASSPQGQFFLAKHHKAIQHAYFTALQQHALGIAPRVDMTRYLPNREGVVHVTVMGREVLMSVEVNPRVITQGEEPVSEVIVPPIFGFVFKLRTDDGDWWPEDDFNKYHIYWEGGIKASEYVDRSELIERFGFLGFQQSVIGSGDTGIEPVVYSREFDRIFRSGVPFVRASDPDYPGGRDNSYIQKHCIAGGKLIWAGYAETGSQTYLQVFSVPLETPVGHGNADAVLEFEWQSNQGLGIFAKSIINGVEQSGTNEYLDELWTISVGPNFDRMVFVFKSSTIEIKADEEGVVSVNKTANSIPGEIKTTTTNTQSWQSDSTVTGWEDAGDTYSTISLDHSVEWGYNQTLSGGTASFPVGVVWTSPETYEMVTATVQGSVSVSGGEGGGSHSSLFTEKNDEDQGSAFSGSGSMQWTRTTTTVATLSILGQPYTVADNTVVLTTDYSNNVYLSTTGLIDLGDEERHFVNYSGLWAMHHDYLETQETTDADWKMVGSLGHNYYNNYQESPWVSDLVFKDHTNEPYIAHHSFPERHFATITMDYASITIEHDGSDDETLSDSGNETHTVENWVDAYSLFPAMELLNRPIFELESAKATEKQLHIFYDQYNDDDSQIGVLVNTGLTSSPLDESFLAQLVGGDSLPAGGVSPTYADTMLLVKEDTSGE